MKEILSDFLYDKKYYIIMYEENIYIFNYIDIEFVSKNKIIIKMEKFNILIKGIDLEIIKLFDKEMVIKGCINDIGKIYE